MTVTVAASTSGITLAVAAIAAAASLVTAVLTAVYGRRTQVRVTELQSRLAEERSEVDAWRSYQFSALTRLYEVYEPLRFQLASASAQARSRIQSVLLASAPEAHRQESPRYRLRSTIYYVLAPSAIFRLMEHRLTLVDFRLDSRLQSEYFLIRSVCISFTSDVIMAGLHPSLRYSPYVEEWREKRASEPHVYRRQGLPLGRLDNSLDALITTDAVGPRLATFGEFEERLRQVPDDNVSSGLGAARDLLLEFTPSTRPVLTRILVAQLLLYRVLLEGLERNDVDYGAELTSVLRSVGTGADLFDDVPASKAASASPDVQVVSEAISPALAYLNEIVLPRVLRILSGPPR